MRWWWRRATRKVDNPRFKAQFHTKAKMLTPGEVEAMVGHAVGGVCPFAVNPGVKIYLDASLLWFETVSPACGSSNSAIELTISELEQYSRFDAWVDVCKGWRAGKGKAERPFSKKERVPTGTLESRRKPWTKRVKLKRAFTGAFALLFAVIVLCAVFCNQNVFGTQSPRSLLAGGLALAVGVLCAAWLLRLLPAPGKRLRRTLLAAFFTLCFLAQAHVGRALVVGATGDWDFGIVLRAALDFAADGAQGGIYFNNFPNNQPLMLLLAELFRLLRACGVTEEYELLVWGMRFGAVLLQLALFFLYLCAARLLGRRAGALTLLLGAATAPFLLYAPVYYTDTVTAPIPIAILYCWLRLRAARREGRPGRGPLAAVFVLGVLGTLLKVTVVIMVIAVVLDWMISFPKLRERLAALALLAAVVAGVNAGSFAAAHSGAFRKAQPGDEIPKTHWIMMGLAGNGGYNNEDYVLTFSAPDGETRKALIRDEIAARLKEMGPAGLVRHALDKIGYTWGEGTYYLPHKLAMGPTQPHSFWAEIFFEGRAHFSLFLRYANGLMLCMLLYLLAGALQKQSRDVLFAARLSVCGLFFFLLIWEARSRYLVNYVPVLLLLFAAAAWGMAGRLPGWGCKQRGTGGESIPG